MYYSRIWWLLAIFLVTPAILQAKSTGQMSPGLQAAYDQAQHRIEVIEEKGKPTYWRAINPANSLNVDFNGKGIEVRTHSLKDDWSLSMELTQLGAPGQLKPANKPSVQIEGNRLVYDRGAIKEWYINDPSGLEQGFTLHEPLSEQQLVLQFVLNGDVQPKLIDKGMALQLTTAEGRKLRYEGLKAWDAKGQDLNATLNLKGNILQLQIAVADAAYPITIDPVIVGDNQRFMATDGTESARFGGAIAISGDTAVVGAANATGVNGDEFAGAVYIFVNDGAQWFEQAKLVVPDEQERGSFGWSVAISGDRVLVGATRVGDSKAGAAYVFTRNGTVWNQQAILTASDGAERDEFGESVAISGDTIIVGAFADDDDARNSGSAYVFTQTGNTWNEQAKLRASDPGLRKNFGSSAAIVGDTAVIGAPSFFDAQGAVYVFTRNGTAWSEQAKLQSSGSPERRLSSEDLMPDHQARIRRDSRTYFGRRIAFSGDTIVAGAAGESANSRDSGAVYVFTKNGTTWSEQAKLLADPSDKGGFGSSVALSGDTLIASGTVYDSAYLFTRSGNTWSQQGKLKPSSPPPASSLGDSLALSGNVAMVGDTGGMGERGTPRIGSVYVFDLAQDPSAGEILIDGDFADWAESQTFSDATDDGSTVNWENVWVDGNGEYLSYSYTNVGDIDQGQLYLWNIYLDVDKQLTTGYNFELLGADYLLQGKSLYQYTGTGQDWSWNYLKEVDYAASDARAELAIAKSTLNLTADASSYRALFYGTDSDGNNLDYLLIDVEAGGGSVISEAITIPDESQ
jgi:hypothetical protein